MNTRVEQIQAELIAAYGRSRLHRSIPSAVAELTVPVQSREFLESVGLPDEPSLLLTFADQIEHLPMLARVTPPAPAGLHVLGREDTGYFCIAAHDGSGQVVSLDPEGRRPIRIVNLRVELLGLFLARYRTVCNQRAGCSLSDAETLAVGLDNLMRSADPAAFIGEDQDLSWWALVTEQMKAGII